MPRKQKIQKVLIFSRPEVSRSRIISKKLTSWIKANHPSVKVSQKTSLPKSKREAPDVILVLGGDGTILEAAPKYRKWNPLIMGFNLGRIGFIASVRKEENFVKALELLFKGKYKADPRMMISADLVRNDKTIGKLHALNEITIQNLFGMVKLKVEIEDHPLQYIHGSGVMVATASGSTAYNLSAHGPIVMPNIRCFIITELLDHNIPTPSIVIKRKHKITITVEDFRKYDRFIITETGKKADVILSADSSELLPLQKGDKIVMRESKYQTRFVEIEKHYFLKSIQEKFAFR